MSLNVFLANERLERAADMLRKTEMQIKEITYSVGYGQGSSFNRAFKKKFNHSPLSYRKQQRKPAPADRTTGLRRDNLNPDDAKQRDLVGSYSEFE